MKNIVLTALILSMCSSVMAFDNGIVNTDYFDNGIVKMPINSSRPVYIPQISNNIQYKTYTNEPLQVNNQIYNINTGSRIGNTYYSPSGTGYTRQGNNIYGSDGSQYTQFGNTIQNNATGKTYQINNNLVTPIN